MEVDIAKKLLGCADADHPILLPPTALQNLTVDDLPEDVSIEIGVCKDGVMHVDWNGRLYRDGKTISGEANLAWSRKYWYAPIGLEHYLDLVRRAVEVRKKIHGDVDLSHYDDDGAFVELSFSIATTETNLRQAYDVIRKVCSELEEASERTSDEIGKHIAAMAARVSGWGAESLDSPVDAVDKGVSTDEKGRSLEELSSRLFESIKGFTVTSRIRTATEEIDLSVLNDSDDPRLRRESAIVLVECKNWSGKCGKNEFVIFREKLENRHKRCTLGFLIAWNGLATTLTKEMLRGSREDILIVPVTGKDIRGAVREGDFPKMLVECWDRAVHL